MRKWAPMRVVLLGPYPPPHGGVQTHIAALRDFLGQNQVTCSVVNITNTQRRDAEGVYYPRHALRVAWLLIRRRQDIVHLHVGGNLTLRLLALGLFCCLLPGSKAVFTLHSGGYPASKDGKTARAATLRGFVLRRFRQLIGVNPEMMQLFQRLGVPSARTRLISPYGVTSQLAQKYHAAGTIEPASLAAFFESHTPILLTVGLLEPEYDLPLQIEAVGLLLEAFPRIGFVIVGSGSMESDIRRLVAGKSYGEHVHLAGDVSHEATLLGIAASDVMLRTTQYDGDSIAVREALQIGAPVVATDNGMRPEGVRLVPPGNAIALREAIASCLADPSPRPRRAVAADEKNLREVLQVYEELMT